MWRPFREQALCRSKSGDFILEFSGQRQTRPNFLRMKSAQQHAAFSVNYKNTNDNQLYLYGY